MQQVGTDALPLATTSASAEAAVMALRRAVEAVRLYGPDHAAALAGAEGLSGAMGSLGWVRVNPRGFEISERAGLGGGAGDFAAALCHANVAMLGFFGGLEASQCLRGAECLLRVLGTRGAVRGLIDELSQVTGGAIRVMPLSAEGVRFVTGGDGRGLDWMGAIDRVLGEMSSQLETLGTTVSGGQESAAVTIAAALSGVPVEQRAKAQEHVRQFFGSLAPDVRQRILELEPGREAAHYDAMGLVAEALPVEDFASAIDAATGSGRELSPHTVRIFSRLIAASRDDAAKTKALREVVKRWQANVGASVKPDPRLRDAIEVLLRSAGHDDYLPESHEQTMVLIGQEAAARSPGTLPKPAAEIVTLGDATAGEDRPASDVDVPWDSTLEHACEIAAVLGIGQGSGETPSVQFLTQRLQPLLEEGHFAKLTEALAKPAGESMELRRALLQGQAIRQLAAKGASEGANGLMAAMGPEAGAIALIEAAKPDAQRSGLLDAARAAGEWASTVRSARNTDALALLPMCDAGAGLHEAERDALIAELLSPGAAPEVAERLIAQVRAKESPWPVPLIAHGLQSQGDSLRREAVREMLKGQTAGGIPALAEYLCDTQRGPGFVRTDWLASMALMAYGEDGAHGLSYVAQTLSDRRGWGSLARQFVIADALRLCRHTEPAQRAMRRREAWKLRLFVRVWMGLALLGGGVE